MADHRVPVREGLSNDFPIRVGFVRGSEASLTLGQAKILVTDLSAAIARVEREQIAKR
jgi:hypothetical protein